MSFWKGKKVFITGHTGFKGSWLSLWLQSKGANVTGYSLAPPTEPNLFTLAQVKENMESIYGDVRAYESLESAIVCFNPEIVFHLAAQPLVRKSYEKPLDTLTTNIIGTANLLEAVKKCFQVRSIVIVTSDKCYDNQEWVWGYRETDRLGGHDPYSCSKACAELVSTSFSKSFFAERFETVISTVRAGNVIGGGDWGEDRLVPDIIRSIYDKQNIIIRNPDAIRPWQHVLEPLSGYLLLAEKSYNDGQSFAGAWNFGPNHESNLPVSALVDRIVDTWEYEKGWVTQRDNNYHETKYLYLDSSKSRVELDWKPRLSFEQMVRWTVMWYNRYIMKGDMQNITLQQINQFEDLINLNREELMK